MNSGAPEMDSVQKFASHGRVAPVETHQCVGRTAVLTCLSSEEPASPRHRAGERAVNF